MVYRIVFTATAKKDIDRLDPVVRRRLRKKFVEIAGRDDIKSVVKRLVDSVAGEYRLRIGDYRVVFDLDKRTLCVLRVRHRRDVYR